MLLVETPEDVDRLEIADPTRLAYLTQTTLSVDDANRIIDRLRARFPQISNPPKEDICYATQNRQEAVKLLSHDANLVLVLGSQNSSNSQRLAELAREGGVKAHLIDGSADIDIRWFQGDETVLITAGASAPELVVEDCVEFLRKRFGATVETRSRARRGSLLPAAARIAFARHQRRHDASKRLTPRQGTAPPAAMRTVESVGVCYERADSAL